MIVDAHVHVVPDAVRRSIDAGRAPDPWFAACHPPSARLETVDGVVAALDAAGVDRAVVLTWPFADPRLCAEANDWLVSALRPHADRLIGFAVVSCADPGAADEVRRAARLGLRGVGELNADAQGWALEDLPAVEPVARACAEADLPLLLHCSEPVGHDYPGKGTATPDRVSRLAQRLLDRVPDLRLVLAHLGGGLPFHAHMPEVAELCRRLWFDTAAIPFLYAPSVYRAVVDLVGADRIVFGSDHPLLPARRYLDTIGSCGLSDAEVAAILGDNAESLLGLA